MISRFHLLFIIERLIIAFHSHSKRYWYLPKQAVTLFVWFFKKEKEDKELPLRPLVVFQQVRKWDMSFNCNKISRICWEVPSFWSLPLIHPALGNYEPSCGERVLICPFDLQGLWQVLEKLDGWYCFSFPVAHFLFPCRSASYATTQWPLWN